MQAISPAVSRLGVRPVPVAIYTRVSTIDQVGGRFDSCESQEELARQHIERNTHKGYFLSGVFPDPAYTGGSMKRPGMQALMRHIEAGHAEVVLIYKFERVLRSTDEWTSFRAFLKKHNCRLESPVEDLSEGTAMGGSTTTCGQTSPSTLDKSLARVNQGLRNCVEALAADGAEMLNEELRERAAELKAEKQRFLDERPQLPASASYPFRLKAMRASRSNSLSHPHPSRCE